MTAHDFFIDVEMIDPAIVPGRSDDCAEGVHDLCACSVVERQCQNHACIAGSRLFSPLQSFLHRLRQLMDAANARKAHIVPIQTRNFLLEVLTQQLHQKIYFRARASLPVLCGERV